MIASQTNLLALNAAIESAIKNVSETVEQLKDLAVVLDTMVGKFIV
ncbi:hypothetical protein [Clostridium sp.]